MYTMPIPKDLFDVSKIQPRDTMRETLENTLKHLVAMVKSNNPLGLMSLLAVYSCISRNAGREPVVLPRLLAYIGSLVEKFYLKENCEKEMPDEAMVDYVCTLLMHIIARISYLDSEPNEDESYIGINRTSSAQELQDLLITGKGYHQHKKKIFLDITDAVLKKNEVGILSGREIYSFVDDMGSFFQKKMARIFSKIQRYEQKTKGMPPEKKQNIWKKTLAPQLPYLFEIQRFLKKNARVMCAFSGDLPYLNGNPEESITPGCGSTYSYKPIWKIDEKYYLFTFAEFEDNLYSLYSHYLMSHSKELSERLVRCRAKYVEKKSAELVESRINSDWNYVNVKYMVDNALYEADAIFRVDNSIFVLEAKSHKMRANALKGRRLTLREQLKEIIKGADIQADRFINYIFEKKSVQVISNGKEVDLDVNGITEFKKIIVLYEDLSPHLAWVSALIDEELINQSNVPWIVALHDLMAVQEIIERPDVFHKYLSLRYELNNRSDIIFHDEMEILGYFMGESSNLPPVEDRRMIMNAFSGCVDGYFMSNQKKPELYLPSNVGALLRNVYERHISGWRQLSLLLLSLNRKTLDSLNSCLSDKLKKLQSFYDSGFEYSTDTLRIVFDFAGNIETGQGIKDIRSISDVSCGDSDGTIIHLYLQPSEQLTVQKILINDAKSVA